MQGYSTLDPRKPGDAAAVTAAVRQLAAFLRVKNPAVELRLMATWSRADQTYEPKGAWYGKPIEAMAHDVRAGYDQAAKASPGIKAVVPVGEAWTRAMRDRCGRPQSLRWDRCRQDRSMGRRQLPCQHLWLLPGSPGAVRQHHGPRSALTGRKRMFGLRIGLVFRAYRALQQVAFDQLAAEGVMRRPRRLGRPAAPAARRQ